MTKNLLNVKFLKQNELIYPIEGFQESSKFKNKFDLYHNRQ